MSFTIDNTYPLSSQNSVVEKIRDVVSTGLVSTNSSVVLGTEYTGTGASNCIVGVGAGGALTLGANNVLVGSDAGDAITTGSMNVLLGNSTDSAATATGCICLGHAAVATASQELVVGSATAPLRTTGQLIFSQA